MPTYAVLLRGINVGRHKQIAMADLRDLLSDLGYTGVRTYLRSGNVVLSSENQTPDEVSAAVEAGIAERFGMDVKVIVRTPEELARVVEANPFPEALAEPSKLFVAFLDAEVEEGRMRAIDPDVYLPDRFAAAGREITHWCPNGLMNTTLTPPFWKALCGDAATTVRNWNTVTKLGEMLDA
jgi:uncharacterized protein (DUF1697 family)